MNKVKSELVYFKLKLDLIYEIYIVTNTNLTYAMYTLIIIDNICILYYYI